MSGKTKRCPTYFVTSCLKSWQELGGREFALVLFQAVYGIDQEICQSPVPVMYLYMVM